MKKVFALIIMLSMLLGSSTLPVRAGLRVQSYVIMAASEQLPPGLTEAITQAGGSLLRAHPEIGLALASSNDPAFAANIASLPGIHSVFPNFALKVENPRPSDNQPIDIPIVEAGDFSGLQWGYQAIHAGAAKAAGLRGAGVRVAILDHGIDADHPDLARNINRDLSISFIPGEDWDLPPGFYNSHGTFIAGIIAARDDYSGVVGIAPEAELVMVKVATNDWESLSLFDIFSGISYATQIQSDIVCMSFVAELPRHGFWFDPGTPEDPSDDIWISASAISDVVTAYQRTINYAYQHGVTLIAAAGNDGMDRDHDKDFVIFPADFSNVIAVSGTGPLGWGVDQSVSLDTPAIYTNFGQSAIDLAAPGGNEDSALLLQPGLMCTVDGVTRPCWVFDRVLSTISEGWSWDYGTSYAVPHVAGVAALIIGQNGGSMPPAQVLAALQATADDLGKPGVDDYYGQGRVNAGNLIP